MDIQSIYAERQTLSKSIGVSFLAFLFYTILFLLGVGIGYLTVHTSRQIQPVTQLWATYNEGEYTLALPKGWHDTFTSSDIHTFSGSVGNTTLSFIIHTYPSTDLISGVSSILAKQQTSAKAISARIGTQEGLQNGSSTFYVETKDNTTLLELMFSPQFNNYKDLQQEILNTFTFKK